VISRGVGIGLDACLSVIATRRILLARTAPGVEFELTAGERAVKYRSQ
jgi:hypothetical protein